MSEIREGYLSAEVEIHVRTNDNLRDALTYCHELNEVGQLIAYDESIVIKPGTTFATYLLLTRMQSNFQAIVRLAKLGMQSEITVLLRTLLETLFKLSAIQIKGDEVLKKLIKDDKHEQSRKARRLLNDPRMAKKAYDHIRKDWENAANSYDRDYQTTKLPDVAELGDLKELYHYYAAYCDDTHTSLTSLSRLFDKVDGKTDIAWGTHAVDPNHILSLLGEAALFMLIAYGKTIEHLGAAREQQVALENVYRLYREKFPLQAQAGALQGA